MKKFCALLVILTVLTVPQMSADIDADAAAGEASEPGDQHRNRIAQIEYYGDIGCSHCDVFEEKILPAAEEAAGISAEVSYFNILTKSGFEQCVQRLAEMGETYSISPIMIIGRNVYQGNSAVEEGLLEELQYIAEHGAYLPASGAGMQVATEAVAQEASRALALLPVIAAGLVDGVNPCAFATMLFFISWITLRGGSRKRILLAGTGFITGVYIAYFSIGLGLFAIFQTAGTLSVLRQVMRYLFSAIALVFAILSLRDAYVVWKTGRAGAMVLQLPAGMKKRIHAVIRGTETKENIDLRILFPALLGTGIVVSLLELACTGQIYFPTIAYMVQSGFTPGALLWLALYNTAFILPLVVLFVIVLFGVSQKRIADWFGRHIVPGKIAAALLFLLLAVVM